MKRVLYKYALKSSPGRHSIPLLAGARFRSCQEQLGQLVIWAEADPLAKIECRVFLVVYTGEVFDADSAVYLTTVQLSSGIVVHVYEEWQ